MMSILYIPSFIHKINIKRKNIHIVISDEQQAVCNVYYNRLCASQKIKKIVHTSDILILIKIYILKAYRKVVEKTESFELNEATYSITA